MRPRDVVAERFEIERLVGSGGMGAVYRARDRKSGEAIALKLLHGSGVEDEIRFAREGRVLSELQHPGIVRHVAHGVTRAGEPYLAMEWIEGEDLAQRLWRSSLRIDEIVILGRCVAEALATAHARGVVHRDIKPSNLLLPAGQIEQVKVVDFGLARFAGASRVVTRTGHVLGTLAYIAPEQARGDRELDARVDVFALGCVLFECLTGRAPFEGKQVITLLTKIVLEDAPRAGEIRPGVPGAIDDLVARMLSRDPDGRPEDGARVAAEFGALDALALIPPASVQRPSLSAREQRLVSVILADMTLGTTSFDLLRAAVEPFEARVERLDEDGCIGAALAGPGSAVDQVAHAARCALSMRAVLPKAPMAVATGPAVLRGRLPMGPLIERAVALLREAPSRSEASLLPLPILLDEVTTGLLDPRFEINPTEPVELQSERLSAVTSPAPLLGKVAPCVGRDRELALLEATLDECIRGPTSAAMLVTGPAGIGKSRLRLELLDRLSRRSEVIAVFCVQGLPLRAGTAFSAIGEIVRGLTDARADMVRDPMVMGSEDVVRSSAFVGSAEDSRTFVKQLIAACSSGPLVILLEDLQWFDLPSLDLLDATLRKKRDLPLLVVGFSRPEVHDLAPKLWVSRNVQEIRLGELTRKASERLARGALGDAYGADEIDRIIARAGGNPHCLSELIRATAQRRGDELPETVAAIVLARLSAFPPEERRLLRAASILGEPFSKDAVGALLGEPTADLDARFEVLVDREILSRQRSPGPLGEDVYTFRHPLLREGADRMLTDSDRVLGHKLAEAWLAGVGGR
jgi:eukaryotic-like serine/threonine-protein kinase